jgi:MFS family permease
VDHFLAHPSFPSVDPAGGARVAYRRHNPDVRPMTRLTATPAATRRSILLLSFATFTSMSTQRICDAMLPELSRVFAVGLPQAARVVSVFAIVYGVLQLFYGPLGDRLGKFRVIAWATLACSLGNLLAVFAGSLEMLVFSRMLVAVFAAAIIPLTLAWLGDVAEPGQLQETIARVGLGTALGVGSGQLLGGLLTDWLGWRWAFGLLALLFALVGLLLLRDLAHQVPMPAPTAHGASRPHFLAQVGACWHSPGRARSCWWASWKAGPASGRWRFGLRTCTMRSGSRCRRPAASWRCSVWAGSPTWPRPVR